MRGKIFATLTALMRVFSIIVLAIGLALVNYGYAENNEKIFSSKGDKKMVVKKGDKVKVSYTGTLADGTVFDKSKNNTPLEFTVGKGEMIPGFDRAIEGMQLNEEKKITIKAEDAFGKRQEALTKQFPRNFFPEDFKPEQGMIIGLKGDNGQSVPARIEEITEESITIDLNHPLAGENLTFDIKLVDIE